MSFFFFVIQCLSHHVHCSLCPTWFFSYVIFVDKISRYPKSVLKSFEISNE